ncbi:MAG: hypothetical protein K8S25_03465 [Alphaproteobacteria bacterium]|nr:hypothetical protein [Alphaproteobacteria bacterium]
MKYRTFSLGTAALACAAALAASPSPADKAASTAAFLEAMKVLNHPRCMNCHTTTAWPTQGDDRHRHTFNVLRGPDGKGAPGMRCTSCHQDKNQDALKIPGAKDWHMAPLSMGWTGLTPGALCAALLDPARNGGRTGAMVIDHMRHDELVLWAWTPDAKRKAPELTHKAFVAALETWVDKGAHCPAP